MSDDFVKNYTQEELDEAKKELENFTPEDLLNLKLRVQIAEDAVSLPEAPGIAFMELRSASGAKINLTARGVNGMQAIDSLAQAVAYARDRYSMTTVGTPMNANPMPMTQSMPIVEGDVPQNEAQFPTVQPVGQSATISSASGGATQTDDEIAVTSITRERKRDGKGDFLRVRGGKYVKFGVSCYQEKFPPGLDVSQMQYGVEYSNIPPFMKFAMVTSAKPYHVTGFHE